MKVIYKKKLPISLTTVVHIYKYTHQEVCIPKDNLKSGFSKELASKAKLGQALINVFLAVSGMGDGL